MSLYTKTTLSLIKYSQQGEVLGSLRRSAYVLKWTKGTKELVSHLCPVPTMGKTEGIASTALVAILQFSFFN